MLVDEQLLIRGTMKYVFWIIMCCCVFHAQAQTRIDLSLFIDGKDREVIIVKPSGNVPPGGYPIVFMFHGTGGNGEKFFSVSQWKEKGEKEKFITVFPSSLSYCVFEDGKEQKTTKWHIAELDSIACPGQRLANDINFVRAIIDTIIRSVPVNTAKIFATGFSNGGAFVSKLAVEMSDVFAAVAPSGGALNRGDSTKANTKIPLWFFLGTKDAKWLDNYSAFGLKEFPFNDSTLRWLRTSLGRFRGILGLDTFFTKTALPKALTYIYSTPVMPGTESAEFRFTLIDGMTHQYPNGDNISFVLADIVWDNFFSKISKNVQTYIDDNALSQVQIYPQPAESFLMVEGVQDGIVEIYNSVGHKVITQSLNARSLIDMSILFRGYYLIKISEGNTQYITHCIKM